MKRKLKAPYKGPAEQRGTSLGEESRLTDGSAKLTKREKRPSLIQLEMKNGGLAEARGQRGVGWKDCSAENWKTGGDGYISRNVRVIKITPRRYESLPRSIRRNKSSPQKKAQNVVDSHLIQPDI